jgi:hypothetical protein
MLIISNSKGIHGRKIRRFPAAEQRFDQKNACCQLSALDVRQCFFAGKFRGLEHDDIDVTDGSGLILIDRNRRDLPGRHNRICLNAYCLAQNAKRGQIVLNLLKGGEHGLAIRSHGCIIGGQRLGALRLA